MVYDTDFYKHLISLIDTCYYTDETPVYSKDIQRMKTCIRVLAKININDINEPSEVIQSIDLAIKAGTIKRYLNDRFMYEMLYIVTQNEKYSDHIKHIVDLKIYDNKQQFDSFKKKTIETIKELPLDEYILFYILLLHYPHLTVNKYFSIKILSIKMLLISIV